MYVFVVYTEKITVSFSKNKLRHAFAYHDYGSDNQRLMGLCWNNMSEKMK